MYKIVCSHYARRTLIINDVFDMHSKFGIKMIGGAVHMYEAMSITDYDKRYKKLAMYAEILAQSICEKYNLQYSSGDVMNP